MRNAACIAYMQFIIPIHTCILYNAFLIRIECSENQQNCMVARIVCFRVCVRACECICLCICALTFMCACVIVLVLENSVLVFACARKLYIGILYVLMCL